MNTLFQQIKVKHAISNILNVGEFIKMDFSVIESVINRKYC